jgi:site-specific DNA-methyltransferase (adenine-specific)
MWELLEGDCAQRLAELEADSIDAIVTDPPYGLSDPPDIAVVLRAWLDGGEAALGARVGFMGAEWDAFVPGPAMWAEAYRVLKPGGHALVFAGTRTMDLMSMALRLAGFEVRDCMMWLYGQGFPKGLNIGKAIDKAAGAERDEKLVPTKAGNAERRGEGEQGATYGDSHGGFRKVGDPVTPEAQKWEGWNTGLKPGWEPIIVCRKPPLRSGIVPTVLEYGTGALNIDGCRIAGDVPQVTQGRESVFFDRFKPEDERRSKEAQQSQPHDAGRWPANVVLSHTDACELLGTRAVKADSFYPAERGEGGISTGGHAGQEGLTEARPDTETVENWNCADGCPVAMLDEQTGELGPGWFPGERAASNRNVYGDHSADFDSGHAEFDTTAGGGSRFFYCSKSSRADRDQGLRQDDNPHPTVKPLDLMRWLVRLVTQPEGKVLDPFAGSGTTGMAALLEGFDFVGCEQDERFAEVARRRLGWAASMGHQASLF